MIFYGGDYMELFIIRHGDPDYARDSLTEKGVREAKLLSERMEKENIDSKNNQKVKLSPITLSSVFANIAFASFRISSLSSLW